MDYKEELLKQCNISLGFINLLIDSDRKLDKITNINITSEDLEDQLKKYKLDCSIEQKKYFFRHLNNYFAIIEKTSEKEKEKQILASIFAYNNLPLNDICYILNEYLHSVKLISLVNIIQDDSFINLCYNQKKSVTKNDEVFSFNINLDISSFPNNTSIYQSINNMSFESFDNFDKRISTTSGLKELFDRVGNLYLESNKNELDYQDISFSGNKTSNKKDENILSNVGEKIGDILGFEKGTKLFKLTEDYLEELHNKYLALVNSLEYDSYQCKYIRTIIYGMTYLLKDTNTIPASYMKNITSIDVGWAVGDENNKSASFYGNSELAKMFYGYYAFMNVKENPYTELINNKYVSEMDYQAMMINKYFKDNGVFDLFFGSGETISNVYKILKNVREVITILDEPILLKSELLNFIKGIIASITNSAAVMIDLSTSELSKSLFYFKILPIGQKKYSLSDIYTYANFIKLICEHSDKLDSISYIDRDSFVSEAYNFLGINKDILAKIGYCSYDSELNNRVSPTSYLDNLFNNEYGKTFTAKEDLKLFYSLLQFAIQKRIYLTNDIEYEGNFSYSNKYLITSTLETLTIEEVFYVFTLYNINFSTLKKKLSTMDNSSMLDFNKNLLNLTMRNDHHNVSFYESYLNSDREALYNKMLNNNFSSSSYNGFISLMRNYYIRVVNYNKDQLDKIVFAANDISDIDDFFLRFIPSILELGKLFDYDIKTFKQIAKLLDSFCYLISDVLFKKLFLNIRFNLTEMIKRYTEDLFKKLDILDDFELKIDLKLGNNKFVRAIDSIIYSLESSGKLDISFIDKCFKDVSIGETSNSYIKDDDLVFNGGHNDIYINDGESIIPDAGKDHIDFPSDFPSNDNIHIKVEGEDFLVDNSSSTINDLIIESDYKNNNQIVYDKGNIIIIKDNGTSEIIISKNDYINSSITIIDEVTRKDLSKDEFKQLVEIRDFIENIKDKEIVNIQNSIKNEQKKIDIEVSKSNPNYSIIKNANKNIEKLTESIKAVKSKNRIISSEPILLKNFSSNSKQPTDDYSYLDNFFNKKELIDNVTDIVVENNMPLTNYQITELLK